MFWGENFEQWERQCLSAILASSSLPNTTSSNTLYYVDYIAITMFTMSKSKHCVYLFCTKISAFFSSTNRTKNSQNFRFKNIILSHTYNPASEAILQKRKPRSNYHIIEIMCCLCIFYDGLIISGKPLIWDLFIRSLYWNSCYLCIIYMALWK